LFLAVHIEAEGEDAIFQAYQHVNILNHSARRKEELYLKTAHCEKKMNISYVISTTK